MIKSLDLASTVDYSMPEDKEQPITVFKLGMIDTRVRKMLEDISWEYEIDPSKPGEGKAKAQFNLSKSEIDFVAFGLKGFEHYVHGDTGKQVYFKTQQRTINSKVYFVVDDSILREMPGDVLSELARKIKEINNVSETDRKN